MWDVKTLHFVLSGIFMNFVSLVGIIGNIVSMYILSLPQMKSSINYLLFWTVGCDTVVIVGAIVLYGLSAIYEYTQTDFLEKYEQHQPLLILVAHPIASMAQTASIYLTLIVTLERYVAVCLPLQARSICTLRRARIFVLITIVFSVLYNLPRIWEVKCLTVADNETNTNHYVLVPTELRSNETYIMVYTKWLTTIVIYIIPFFCLVVFNSVIYNQVRQANKVRKRLSNQRKKEIGLASMMLCIVLIFLLCNTLPLIVNIMDCLSFEVFVHMTIVNNLLVAICYSANIFIFVIFGEKFKRLLIQKFNKPARTSQNSWPSTERRSDCNGKFSDSV